VLKIRTELFANNTCTIFKLFIIIDFILDVCIIDSICYNFFIYILLQYQMPISSLYSLCNLNNFKNKFYIYIYIYDKQIF